MQQSRGQVHSIEASKLCIYTNCEAIRDALAKDSDDSTYDKIDRGIKDYMQRTNRLVKGEYAYACEFDESTETQINYCSMNLSWEPLLQTSVRKQVEAKTTSVRFWDDVSGKPLDPDLVIADTLKKSRRLEGETFLTRCQFRSAGKILGEHPLQQGG